MSCCKLSQEKAKYLDVWIRSSHVSCLDGSQTSFTLQPFYIRIKRAMYLPKTSTDNTFCPYILSHSTDSQTNPTSDSRVRYR